MKTENDFEEVEIECPPCNNEEVRHGPTGRVGDTTGRMLTAAAPEWVPLLETAARSLVLATRYRQRQRMAGGPLARWSMQRALADWNKLSNGLLADHSSWEEFSASHRSALYDTLYIHWHDEEPYSWMAWHAEHEAVAWCLSARRNETPLDAETEHHMVGFVLLALRLRGASAEDALLGARRATERILGVCDDWSENLAAFEERIWAALKEARTACA